jgi:23S rRNA pseudouridine1911/1915/1917 synthase
MTDTAPITLTIDDASARQRLDKVLAQHLPDISRSRLKGLIEDGAVRIGDAPCTDAARKLKAGEVVELVLPRPVDAAPLSQDIPLAIVHDDANLVVIDKPAGMVVHPSAGHETGTLVNAVLHHCRGTLSGINGVLRPGIVHRLDKDTSGLIVVAKTDAAHKALAAQFADHGREGPLERLYLAFCWGVPSRPHGSIDAALARSTVNREKIAVVPEDKGRFAITHYQLRETFAGTDGKPVASLVECALETGRTHQIRVHMAHIGHPLLGDSTYGAGFKTKANLLGAEARAALEALDRQALHAAVLGFEDPDGTFLRFESPLPPELEKLLAALRYES